MGGVAMKTPPVLPACGCWALGTEAQGQAEILLQRAQAQGLRTAWLGAEAGFLSNLSIMENLRLVHDWPLQMAQDFQHDLQQALRQMGEDSPAWLQARPAELLASQQLRAKLLRVLLLRPDVLVVSPHSLAQLGPARETCLLSALAGARILLLDAARSGWPAWPAHELMSATSAGEPT